MDRLDSTGLVDRSAHSSVLVIEHDEEPRTATCGDLFASTECLVFAAHRTPEAVVADWEGDLPDRLRILRLDGGPTTLDLPESVSVGSFRPDDLAGIGLAVDEWLGSDAARGRPTVCLGGIGTFLEAVDRATAFRFLHALCARIERSDATLHAHLTASEQRTVTTVVALFDLVLSYDGETYHRRETIL